MLWGKKAERIYLGGSFSIVCVTTENHSQGIKVRESGQSPTEVVGGTEIPS